MTVSKQTIRAFVCFEVPHDLRSRLAEIIAAGRRAGERIAWVRPENIHLTVKFLGDIARDDLPDVADMLHDIAANSSPFSIHIDRLGAFPNTHRPRVIWAGASEVPHAGKNFVARVDQALSGLGFPAESRPFKPHLTIGRVKQGGGETMRLVMQQSFGSYELPCKTLVLMRSELKPGGAVYTPLEKIMVHSS